jgi:hypothetical protein
MPFTVNVHSEPCPYNQTPQLNISNGAIISSTLSFRAERGIPLGFPWEREHRRDSSGQRAALGMTPRIEGA